MPTASPAPTHLETHEDDAKYAVVDSLMASMGFHRVDEASPPDEVDGKHTEPDEKMLLSVAMRQGIARFPSEAKTFFTMYDTETHGDKSKPGACAMGCVYWATTGKNRFNWTGGFSLTSDTVINELSPYYPELEMELDDIEIPVEYMKNAVIPLNLYSLIVDLNDSWGWTRARIADWLESIGY